MKKTCSALRIILPVMLFAAWLLPDAFCRDKDTFLKDYRKSIDELEDAVKAIAKGDADRAKNFMKLAEDFSVKSAALQSKVKEVGYGDLFAFDAYPAMMVKAQQRGPVTVSGVKKHRKKISFQNLYPDLEFIFDLMRHDVDELKKAKFSYENGTIDEKYRKYPDVCRLRFCFEYCKNPVKAEKRSHLSREVYEKRLEAMRKIAENAEAEAGKLLPENFSVPPFENDVEILTACYLQRVGSWKDASEHAVSKKLMVPDALKERRSAALKEMSDFFKKFDKFVSDGEKSRAAEEKKAEKAAKEAEKEKKRRQAGKTETSSDEQPSVEEKTEKPKEKDEDDDGIVWRDGGGRGVWK